jgi:predicted helicase
MKRGDQIDYYDRRLNYLVYRQKYADNLKRELPRIPFAADIRAFAKAGEKLAKLHLDYEKVSP